VRGRLGVCIENLPPILALAFFFKFLISFFFLMAVIHQPLPTHPESLAKRETCELAVSLQEAGASARIGGKFSMQTPSLPLTS